MFYFAAEKFQYIVTKAKCQILLLLKQNVKNNKLNEIASSLTLLAMTTRILFLTMTQY